MVLGFGRLFLGFGILLNMVRELGNDKYFDRIWDLIVFREVGRIKICVWDEGFNFFVCLLEIVII